MKNWDNITKNEEVKQLFADRTAIEEAINRLDKNALINFELEIIGCDPVESKWISVDDRLPDETGTYIVAYTNTSNEFAFATFTVPYDIWYHIRTGNQFLTVTHWQPLPEPPKS